MIQQVHSQIFTQKKWKTNIVHYISDSDECKGKKSMKTENNE